jgi:hypothetical protein
VKWGGGGGGTRSGVRYALCRVGVVKQGEYDVDIVTSQIDR